jgi:hypothetical protein
MTTFVLAWILMHGAVGDIGKPMPYADRVCIAEAGRIADQLADRVWPGWSDAPFALLLVTSDQEYLVHHPRPTADFKNMGYDSLLHCDVYTRPRVFDAHLLATFPAVGGISTIVVGEPKNTDASHSTRWVMTVLHEHFHQWQQSWPGYNAGVTALGLARGDSTGMWMLNYPFPYDSVGVGESFAVLCQRLGDAVSRSERVPLRVRVRAFEWAKEALRAKLGVDDYAYFSFQVWQEGVARYTEYQLARLAAVAYKPTAAFAALPDFVPFAQDAEETRAHVLNELARMALDQSRRTAFYHEGAAEAMLLDRVNPGWRALYFDRPFSLDSFWETRP